MTAASIYYMGVCHDAFALAGPSGRDQSSWSIWVYFDLCGTFIKAYYTNTFLTKFILKIFDVVDDDDDLRA